METRATSEKHPAMLDASDTENTSLHANTNTIDSSSSSTTKPSASGPNNKLKTEAAASPSASTSCSDRSDQCSPAVNAEVSMPAMPTDPMLGFDAAAAYAAVSFKDLPFDARMLCDPSWGAYESPQSVYAMLLGSSPGSLSQLLPPPAISTSGLLPSPTASSFLMHQLQQQQQQQLELQQQQCMGTTEGGQPSAGPGTGGDPSALMASFYASAAFASSLPSPHPYHGLLSPLHASMGSQSQPASSSSTSTTTPSPVITMADMMAGDPTLLLTSPTAAGMFKHFLPSYTTHPPPPLSTSLPPATSMTTPAPASPSVLLSIPPTTASVKDMTLNELRPHFNKPMAVVAKELGVCITLMKKICRRNGLVRWPHRRIRSLVNRITSLQVIAATASGAEKKRFQAQIAALREELSAVIQNPNEKSRKAQADARARSPGGMLLQDDADTEASLSAMLRECGGGLDAGVDDQEAASGDENDDVKPRKSSKSDKKGKKKSKSKTRSGKELSPATIEPLEPLESVPAMEEESPRTVSGSLGAQAKPRAVVNTRSTKKRKRMGARFGNALPPPPIKIPRLDDKPDRPRCHSAPERRSRDKKKARKGGEGGNDGEKDPSPTRSSCVRPATTTNRGKRGSISSILCHSVDHL